MRTWISLLENYALATVNNEDIIDYYQEDHRDLDTLMDNEWILTVDYTSDIEALKRTLAPYAKGSTITLYRAIRGKPDTNNLGIHWSVDSATDFGETMMTIEAPISAVDWVGTIARGVHWWNDEQEITLTKGEQVMIQSIVDTDQTRINIVGKI